MCITEDAHLEFNSFPYQMEGFNKQYLELINTLQFSLDAMLKYMSSSATHQHFVNKQRAEALNLLRMNL
jgi:hypothetical protein